MLVAPGNLLRIGGLACCFVVACVACNPLDSDDNSPTPPAAQTREVIVSTFTATEVVPPEEQTATAGARETSAAMTATEIAINPPATPTFAMATPEEILTPPLARLVRSDGQSIEATLSSYSWQFSDEIQTFFVAEAPITQFEHDPVSVANGAQFTIELFGEEYRQPPLELLGALYDFESNSAFPVGPDGQPGSELGFAIRTAPAQNLDLEPANPAFAIDVPPGRYALWIQGRWGEHPDPRLDEPIFVTWVFNLDIE